MLHWLHLTGSETQCGPVNSTETLIVGSDIITVYNSAKSTNDFFLSSAQIGLTPVQNKVSDVSSAVSSVRCALHTEPIVTVSEQASASHRLSTDYWHDGCLLCQLPRTLSHCTHSQHSAGRCTRFSALNYLPVVTSPQIAQPPMVLSRFLMIRFIGSAGKWLMQCTKNCLPLKT